MTAPHQPVHRAYCVVRTAPGSVRVLLRLQVGLEDRLQHQHRRRLHHPVTYRRDSQGPLPSVRLLQPHPAHRGGSIALVPELLHQLPKPRLPAPRLNRLERLAVHPRWWSLLHRSHGIAHRHGPRCPLGTPCRRARRTETRVLPSLSHAAPFAASRPSAVFAVSSTIPASLAPASARPRPRPLRSTGITRLPHYYGPLRHPERPGPVLTDDRFTGHASRPPNGASRVASLSRVHACHRHYPGRTAGCACRSPSPATAAFPETQAGRLLHYPFRGLLSVHCSLRPACARQVPEGPSALEASAASLPPRPFQLLPAGTTVAGWESHPLRERALHGALSYCG